MLGFSELYNQFYNNYIYNQEIKGVWFESVSGREQEC